MLSGDKSLFSIEEEQPWEQGTWPFRSSIDHYTFLEKNSFMEKILFHKKKKKIIGIFSYVKSVVNEN